MTLHRLVEVPVAVLALMTYWAAVEAMLSVSARQIQILVILPTLSDCDDLVFSKPGGSRVKAEEDALQKGMRKGQQQGKDRYPTWEHTFA